MAAMVRPISVNDFDFSHKWVTLLSVSEIVTTANKVRRAHRKTLFFSKSRNFVIIHLNESIKGFFGFGHLSMTT